LNQIRKRLYDPHRLPLRFVVLDFKNVIGLDSSAVRTFIKIKQIAAENQLKLIFIDIEPTVLNRLERGECKIIEDPFCLSFLNMNQGLEWCEEQIFKLDHVEALKTANVREQCSSSSGKSDKKSQNQSNPDYQPPATAGYPGREFLT